MIFYHKKTGKWLRAEQITQISSSDPFKWAIKYESGESSVVSSWVAQHEAEVNGFIIPSTLEYRHFWQMDRDYHHDSRLNRVRAWFTRIKLSVLLLGSDGPPSNKPD